MFTVPVHVQNDMCNPVCPISGSVRLVDGDRNNEGLLEQNVNGRWTGVCGDSFNNNAAAVVCRELGFPP